MQTKCEYKVKGSRRTEPINLLISFVEKFMFHLSKRKWEKFPFQPKQSGFKSA